MEVRLSEHAKRKIETLKNHEVKVTEESVVEAVNSPDRVLTGLGGRQIAERRLDEGHVLRVVFINEGETRRVITLYPSRKGRYG